MFVDHIAPNRLEKLRSPSTLGNAGLDVVAERLQQRRRGARAGGALGVDVAAVRVVVEQPDAQPARVGAQLVDVRTGGRRGDHGVADARSADGVEQPGGVAHGARRRTARRSGSTRRAPARARSAPATASARPGRSTTPGCGSNRHRRWRGRSAPGRRPPRRPIRHSTRRACATRSHGLCEAPHASGSVVGTLPNSGLFVRPAVTNPAARNRPTSVVSASDGASSSASALVAVADRLPGVGRPQVLEQERDTAERPVGQVAGGHRAGVVEPADDDGVELRIERLDPLDRRVEQLRRADLTGGDQLGLGGGVEPAGVVGDGAHGRRATTRAGRRRRPNAPRRADRPALGSCTR